MCGGIRAWQGRRGRMMQRWRKAAALTGQK
jgi:hypothetical protein